MKKHSVFIVFILINGLTHTLKAQTPGTLKWQYMAGPGVYSSPAIGDDGTVYVGSIDDYLYAINPDGTRKWRYRTGDNVSSPTIGADGTVYAGSGDAYLYAVNPDGTLKWRYQTEDAVRATCPAIGTDGTIYVWSKDDYLYAINPDGVFQWRYTITQTFDISVPVVDTDGTLYIGSGDKHLYTINPNGKLKWRYQAGHSVTTSPAIGSDGTIYVGCRDHFIYAVNPDGTLKWRFDTGVGVIESSPAIGEDGTIYVGSWDDSFYAINPDGTLKWSYQTGDNVLSSPAIGADGTVYVGSDDGTFYAFNPDGTVKWTYQGEGSFVRIQSSPAIGEDGIVYVGSSNGYLHAIYSSSQGLADSPWPKYQQNNRNTGSLIVISVMDQIEFAFFNPGEAFQKTFTMNNPTSKNLTVSSCAFAHAAFSLSTPLPLTIELGSASPLTATITPGNQGLYQSTCQITYETDGETKTISTQVRAGLFLEDGSETALTAHRAVDAYQACIAENASSAAAKNNLGVLFRLLGETDLAEQALMKALSLGQGELHGYSGIKMNVGVVQSDKDNSEQAHQYYNSAQADVTSDESASTLAPQIHYNKAWEAYIQDDLYIAEESINKTIDHDKANDFLKAKAYVLRGAIFLLRGDNASAGSDFEQAIVLDPDGPIGQLAQENLETGVTYVADQNAPITFVLGPNYPNPFNPETTVSFGLPRESDVTLEIYNVRGQRIRSLLTRMLKAGWHHVTWSGVDDTGNPVGSGIYFIKMKAGEFESSHKMTLLR